MPLFIQDREVDHIRSSAELYFTYPHLQETARAFRSKELVVVDKKTLLYVQQRECAATTPADKFVSVVGSEDATTCHLVVLRHTGSGAVCVAHCDGSNPVPHVLLIVKAVKSLSEGIKEGRFELHVVGGFDDERRTSHKLTLSILTAFQMQEEDVHLELCCTTEMNDHVVDGIHKPKIYGIGANVKTGEVFPASFPYKGPAEYLRSAGIYTGGEMTEIYEPNMGLLKVGPFKWSPKPELQKWLIERDANILLNLSTSPLAEPPNFVKDIKSTFWFILTHPNPDSLFPGGQPQLYQKTKNGDWKLIIPS